MTEAQRRDLLRYLAGAAETVDFLDFDAEEETVTLDFAETIAALSYLQELVQKYPFIAPETVVGDGVVTITYRPGI